MIPFGGPPAAPALIDEFVSRYENRKTVAQYRTHLGGLFGATGRTHPRQLRVRLRDGPLGILRSDHGQQKQLVPAHSQH